MAKTPLDAVRFGDGMKWHAVRPDDKATGELDGDATFCGMAVWRADVGDWSSVRRVTPRKCCGRCVRAVRAAL